MPRIRPVPILAFVSMAALSAARLGAQGTADSARAALPIERIAIIRDDVFSGAESRRWYARFANRFHAVTRADRIRGELLLRPGQPYDSTLALESERNLRRLGVFGSVRVDSVRTDSGLVLRVRTRDAWSTIPWLTVGVSAGEVSVGGGITELNVAGSATAASVSYSHDPDRWTAGVAYSAPRIIAGRVGVSGAWRRLSDGRSSFLSVSQPFYSTMSRAAFGLSGSRFDGRVVQYRGGERTPDAILRRRRDVVAASGAWALRAGNRSYLRAALDARIRRDDTVPDTPAGPLPRSVSAALTPSISFGRTRYRVVHDYQAMTIDEDIDLGTSVSLGMAIAPDAWGYANTAVGPVVGFATGAPIGSGFVLLGASMSGLASGGALDSGTVAARGTVVLHPAPWHALILRAEVGRRWDPAAGDEFDLGGLTGPRGFRSHSFTGDQAYLTVAEYRVTPWRGVFGLADIGIAGFVDHGGAWYRGEARRTGTSFGGGLRLGSARLAPGAATRIDVAWRPATDVDAGDVVFSVGIGIPIIGR
ncbi:MAG TPA: hypothetical protein VFG84_04110 [Gemmatimonadaceae bacterium]|nr:hypothetical protein [Gemmatimonadaceae bacterium]